MSPELTPKSRAGRILDESLTPELKRRGFSKRRDTYVRGSGRVLHLLDVQRSRWNDTKEVSFTLNCGVYMPGVTSTFRDASEPKQPKLSDCCITVRVGMLTEAQLDVWWKVSAAADHQQDAAIASELESMIERTVLPFFERFQTEKAVAEFLSQAPRGADKYTEPRADGLRLAYAAIAWSVLGAADDCHKCLERAVLRSKKSPLESVVTGFVGRFNR